MRWSFCQVLLLQVQLLAAIRPEYGLRDPKQSQEEKSLFAALHKKLEPVLGRKLQIWHIEAAALGGTVLLMLALLWCMRRPAAAYSLPPLGDQEAGEGNLDQKLSLLKKQKTKILMHQVIEKQKLERILKDIMRLEAERKQEAADVDPEAVKARAEETIKAVDISMSKNMTTALAYMMPVMLQSQRVYETIDKRSKKAQEMIARAALDEVKNLTKDMQDVFEVDDIKGQLFKSIGEIDAPSLATIIASAFAPAQLRLLHLANLISMAMVLIILVLDALVLVGDRGAQCDSYVWESVKDQQVDMWFKVDLGISGFCLLVRFGTFRTLAPLIQEMDNPPMLEMQDDPVRALRALLAYYLHTGSMAMMRVDAVSGSVLYGLTSWSVVFNLFWMGYGGDLVLNTPWLSCRDPGIIILRTRFLLFLVFIVPVVLNVVFFFVGRMLNGESLQISLLQAAGKVDEALNLGVPLCSLLVQAFFIRNKKDMINIQLKILQMKKEEADRQRQEAEAQLSRLQGEETSQSSEVESLQQQLRSEADKNEDERLQEQVAQREKVLQEAEQVFGLLNDRAKKASSDAAEQVKRWEDGHGGELLEALSKGEGGAKLQEIFKEVDVEAMAGGLQRSAQQGLQQAQERGQELYGSQVQGILSGQAGEQLQAALAAGQEAASSAAQRIAQAPQ